MGKMKTTKTSAAKSAKRTRPKLTAWSFSRFTKWRECPRRLSYVVHDRMREPGSPAMDRGAAIHKKAEQFVDNTLPRLPAELKLFNDEFKELRTKYRKDGTVTVEDEWAFTAEWAATSWFGDDTWLRVKVDVFETTGSHSARLVDHKTGKPHPDNDQLQLDLYALTAFKRNRNLFELEAELWYLDQGDVTQGLYERDELPVLQREWLDRVKPMLADTRFPATPGNQCRWCPFSQAKGGPCEY